jgi:carboxylesterase type B
MLCLPTDAIPKDPVQFDEFECLNLTVTRPAGLNSQECLPVMLWIHGGGNRGHGSNWLCDGGSLVRKSMLIEKPVIIVAINFRIGFFGFAASNNLRDDNKMAGDDGVGNYGLRDQRKAMEWLHNFIAGFGGDPNNVTLFGTSTGAADIVSHLLSQENESHPLFQRAIVQSAILEPIPDTSSAGWHLSRAMATLQISTIKELRSVEYEKLIDIGFTSRAVDDGLFLRPGWQDFFGDKAEARSKHRVVEPHLEHRSPSKICSNSNSIASLSSSPTPQPLIIGDCSCDSLLWSMPASLWTPGAVVRRLRAVCQSLNKSSILLRGYDITPYSSEDDIIDHVLDLINDARVAWPTECIAEGVKRERGVGGVWRYVFDQESPSRGLAHHAADLVYLFDNVPLDTYANDPTTPTTVVDSPEMAITPTHTAVPTPPNLAKSAFLQLTPMDNRHLKDGLSSETEFYEEGFFDHSDSDESVSSSRNEDYLDWMQPIVDEWSYMRVRDAMQEKWIAFAHGQSPWKEDKVFVFGPEGETGERSMSIFEGRRRRRLWQEALEPLGMSLVQKIGLELSRGPNMAV